MMRILRENGLSITLFALFAVFLVGQTIVGQATYNQQRTQLGLSPLSYLDYLVCGQNIEAIFENWESEFLQMGCNVLFAAFLFQKGSAVSKKLDGSSGSGGQARSSGPDAPWPARQGGWVRAVYAHSLSIAFFALFIMSFLAHAVGGRLEYNVEQVQHGEAAVSFVGFLTTSTFWFQSLQNYQSEFLALGAMVVLSIFLRQDGSPQSKPLDAPMSQTGH